MVILNKSYLKGSSFKQNLWSEVSTECSGGQWSYSFSERRLFFVLTIVTIFLMSVYLTGRMQEVKGLILDVNALDSVNSEKIQEINQTLPSPTVSAEV